jgi:hypothetical protein
MEIKSIARFKMFFSSTIKALVINMLLNAPPSLMPKKPAARLMNNKILMRFKTVSLLLSFPILINSNKKISKLSMSSCLSNIKMLDSIILII